MGHELPKSKSDAPKGMVASCGTGDVSRAIGREMH